MRLEISEDDAAIAALVLCSSKSQQHNPLSLSMLKQITQLARFLSSADPVAQRVKVCVIRGSKYDVGGSFCVGAELSGFSMSENKDTDNDPPDLITGECMRYARMHALQLLMGSPSS